MMGNPYAMLAGCAPAERAGVHGGIFNGFIVLPMLLQILTLPLLDHRVLGDNPEKRDPAGRRRPAGTAGKRHAPSAA